MRDIPDRRIFIVARLEAGWTVEHDGVLLDRCANKEEAKAAANKHARAAQDAGLPCQVRISGEPGFFTLA